MPPEPQKGPEVLEAELMERYTASCAARLKQGAIDVVQISDLIINHPEITSFAELEELVKEAARRGEIHLSFDLKPEYLDTPRKWQDRLETAFTSIIGSGR